MFRVSSNLSRVFLTISIFLCAGNGSVAERIRNLMSKAGKNQLSSSKPSLVKVRPRRSMQDLSNNNNNSEPITAFKTSLSANEKSLSSSEDCSSSSETTITKEKASVPIGPINQDAAPIGQNTAAFIEDMPKELPSVKNLASMFTAQPRKSPEPLPRRSLIKVRMALKVFFPFYVLLLYKFSEHK